MKTNYLIWGCVTAIAVIAWGMYYSTTQVPTETIDATAQSFVETNVEDEERIEDLINLAKWATLEAKTASIRSENSNETNNRSAKGSDSKFDLCDSNDAAKNTAECAREAGDMWQDCVNQGIDKADCSAGAKDYENDCNNNCWMHISSECYLDCYLWLNWA